MRRLSTPLRASSLVAVPSGSTNDDVRGGGSAFFNAHILAPTLRRSCRPSSIRFIASSASMLDGTNLHPPARRCPGLQRRLSSTIISIHNNINFNCQVLVPTRPWCCAVWKHQGCEGAGKAFLVFVIFSCAGEALPRLTATLVVDQYIYTYQHKLQLSSTRPPASLVLCRLEAPGM